MRTRKKITGIECSQNLIKDSRCAIKWKVEKFDIILMGRFIDPILFTPISHERVTQFMV